MKILKYTENGKNRTVNSITHFLEFSVNILLYLLNDNIIHPTPLNPPINVSYFSDAFQNTLYHSEELSLNADSWVPIPEILILRI